MMKSNSFYITSIVYTFVVVSSSEISENFLELIAKSDSVRGRGASGALLPGSASLVPSATTVITAIISRLIFVQCSSGSFSRRFRHAYRVIYRLHLW